MEESTGLEIWKLIPWLNGYYAVSNRGRVRRAQPGTHTHSGRLLKPWKDKVGYLRIVLSTPLGNWSGLVHHLVLETFIGPRPYKMECNHKNGKKDDNGLENLEWTTRSANIKHAYSLGLTTPLRPMLRRKGSLHPAFGRKLSDRARLRISIRQRKAMARISRRTARVIIRRAKIGSRGIQRILADEYGVTKGYISNIVRGYTWHSKPR